MLPFGDFMKSKFFTCLLLATSISSGFADTTISTLAQRDAMVREALSKSSEEALKKINEEQQSGQIKTDDQNYVVVIKKDGEKYIRVAHSKSDRLEEKNKEVVDLSLVEAMKQAEKDLANTSGPIPFSFSANGKTLWAVLSKKDAYMFFNICAAKDDVDKLLKPADKPAEVPAAAPAVVAPAPEKPAVVAPAAEIPASAEKKPDGATAPAAASDTPVVPISSDKATTPAVKPADKVEPKAETLSSEKKLEEVPAPAVGKKAVSDAVPMKIEQNKADPAKEVAAAAA